MRKYIVFDVQKKGQPALGVFSFEYSPKIVNQHRKEIKHLIFVGILSVIPRIPCLFGGFVFDDRPAILDNQDVVKNNFDSIWNTIFLHDFWGGNLTAKSSHKSYRFVVLLFIKQNNDIGVVARRLQI